MQALNIYIKTTTNKSFILSAKHQDTIDDILNHIRIQQCICPNKRLVVSFGGKELEECRTLSDYNVQNESTLFLSMSDSKKTRRLSRSVSTSWTRI